ncbi:MAG: hypothetical protein R3346_03050 [Candidatus Spechtbacterales bacterium]|nr:hypothetical protein [Candidatus Spechtbacterales bacterium]
MSKTHTTNERIAPYTKAQRNPSTVNPGTIKEDNQTKNALITKVNKPRVKIFIGRVKKTKIGFMKIFRIPRTNATAKAVRNPETTTPGKMYAVTATARVVISQFISFSIYKIKIINVKLYTYYNIEKETLYR